MSRIFRNPEVLWREENPFADATPGPEPDAAVEDPGTSLLFANGQMVALNLLGTEVWKLCDGRSVEEMVAYLLEEFEVEPEVLREDIDAFLASLAAKGFIRYDA
jgi:pyrroloquinoline quinone biosynthesis protein D